MHQGDVNDDEGWMCPMVPYEVDGTASRRPGFGVCIYVGFVSRVRSEPQWSIATSERTARNKANIAAH